MTKRLAILLLGLAVAASGPGPIGAAARRHEKPGTPALEALRSIPSPAAPGSAEPNLTVSPDGDLWLSWLEPRARGGHALKVSRLDGHRWTLPLTAAEGDSFFANWADFPGLVAYRERCLAAFWLWRCGEDVYAYEVRMAFSGDGGRTWSDPVRPHTDGTATEHGFVSALAEGDAARAVWLDGRNFATARADSGAAAGASHGGHGPGADMTIRSALVHANGSLTEEALLDGRTCECCQTAAARTSRGVLVAYRGRSADEVRDIVLARLEGGRWSEPYALHEDGWKIEGCPVNGPALDAEDARVAAAWYTAAADSPRVLLALSGDAGRSFGPPLRVDEGEPLGRVDVALLEDGSTLVCWLESRPEGARILVRRVGRDGARSPALAVAETSAKRASGFPRMVRNGRRLVFTWTEAGTPSQVRVAEAMAGRP